VDPELVTGDFEVDEQHRALFALVGAIRERVAQGATHDDLADCFFEMLHYAGEHFDTEEALMRRTRYPRLAEQRRLHDKFFDDALMMVESFLDGHAIEPHYVLEYMEEWLHQHVDVEDRKLAEFLWGT